MKTLKAMLPLVAILVMIGAPSFAEDTHGQKEESKDKTLVDGKKSDLSKQMADSGDKDCSCKEGKCDGESCAEKQNCKSCKGQGQKDCKKCKGIACKDCKMHHHDHHHHEGHDHGHGHEKSAEKPAAEAPKK